jgi:hypothetical protein
MAWQKASGYNRRASVEVNISRYQRVIGEGLRSHTDGRQATEIAIAVGVLNRVLELGRPESIRNHVRNDNLREVCALSLSMQQAHVTTPNRSLAAFSGEVAAALVANDK